VVFRTRSLDQPFEPYPHNPILTQRDLDPGRANPITSTGHADFVQTPAGDWWAVFLGVRAYARDYHNTGRETFLLPVRWSEGWPVILAPRTPVPWQAKRPALAPNTEQVQPQTGNFVWRDEFDQAGLKLDWLKVRTSPQEWLTWNPASGSVMLDALPVALADQAQPAFLARRQQHLDFAASTRMELPHAAGIVAGLVAFQGPDFHYFFSVRKADGGFRVELQEVRAGTPATLASEAWAATGAYVVLGMEQEGGRLGFYYAAAADPARKAWLIRDVDARLLSTQVAGGFVGATIGIHARREPTADPGDRDAQ
jgi:alpha-N-arabinofuranosidase